jgi:hypothetical protein
LNVIPSTVMAGLPGIMEVLSPPLLGSGKLEIPCARMHCESAREDASPLGVVAPAAAWPPPEEPQALMAAAQPAMAIATARRMATALLL